MIRRRQRLGQDRFDEVWNGVYVMAPNADNVHQSLVTRLTYALIEGLGNSDCNLILTGVNISDRVEQWTKNYRLPDVADFPPGNPAEDRGSHYLGGPDFAVEILSKRDRSRKKFDFYAKVGVRELLLMDRHPWALEFYRLERGVFQLAGKSGDVRPDEFLDCQVLPLSFHLLPGNPRPRVEVISTDDERNWMI